MQEAPYTILFSSIRMLVGGYSALYLTNHGLTIADISFLKAFQGVVVILIQVPIGVIIDRCNNRFPFILIAIFLASIWMFLTAQGNTSLCFFAAELFNGLSLAIFNAVMLPILVETYLYETGKEDYNYTIGKFFKYQNLLMVAPVLLGSMFVVTDSRAVWFIASLALIAMGGFSLLAHDLKRFNAVKSENNKPVKNTKSHFNNLLCLIKADNITPLFIANIALMTVFQILAQFWQVIIYGYLDQQSSYAGFYGGIFSLILIFQAIGSFVAEKKNSLNISLLSMVLFIAITTYLLTYDANEYDKIISVVLFLFCFILFRYPSIIISALLHKNINNEIRATFDALLNTLSMMVSIVAFYLIGVLLHSFGDKIIILSLMVLTITGFLCTFLYVLKTKYRLKNNKTSISLQEHAL